ncbi:hydrogen gas-evolving membrane-bound hydrogenase subunit E [uncultured Maritalea sp.]|uniref:hydrogen gas-evolving membrane-bound hydrogenase subunit E n=1 Tax=uncultured Maritalea sp. TaxID=757249 RepID=UPI00345D8233
MGAAPFFSASSHAPAQTHLGPDYLEKSPEQIGVPNVVTAILASYRGYDTLGETAVVFTAAVGVLLLISGLRRRRRTKPKKDT